jgi:flagellar biosynthesis regulator FlaF
MLVAPTKLAFRTAAATVGGSHRDARAGRVSIPMITSAPGRETSQRAGLVPEERLLGRTGIARASSSNPDGAGLQETAALDELIDILLASTSQEQLAKTVAENALSFDQKFWLRLAARTDTADEDAQQQLKSLATTVMQIVDVMVQQTDEKLSGSSEMLEQILIAGADEDSGEWSVPFPAERVSAMKDVMMANYEAVDEALLSSCFAWMKKASDDKLDGMVYILQTVLQLYASIELSRSGDGTSEALSKVLKTPEGEWESLIRDMNASGEISEESFLEEVQKKMETIVLGRSSGSYDQRILAEFLSELQERANAAFGKE